MGNEMKTIKITRLNAQETFKCGECLHHTVVPHRTHKALCSKEGVRAFAQAPLCFTPNYQEVITSVTDFVQLSSLFLDKSTKEKKILLGVLRSYLKPRKFEIGTQVFFNIKKAKYLSNYLQGNVVGYTSSNEIIVSGSSTTDTDGRLFWAYLQSDSNLLGAKAFAKLKAEMIKRGRVVDPKATGKKGIADAIKEDTYEVPTIDRPISSGEVKPSKKSSRATPLVEIFSF